MNIQPIRIYGDDDKHERIETEQDKEIILPEPIENEKEELENNLPDFEDTIDTCEEEECRPIKKNSLFGSRGQVQKKEKKEYNIPIVYIAMGLGLIKFLF